MRQTFTDKRVFSWALYDWANSAFATTILAAVLPAYYSSVAGKTLASPATATAIWSTTLSISLVIVAILSPILGTVADVVPLDRNNRILVQQGLRRIRAGVAFGLSDSPWDGDRVLERYELLYELGLVSAAARVGPAGLTSDLPTKIALASTNSVWALMSPTTSDPARSSTRSATVMLPWTLP